MSYIKTAAFTGLFSLAGALVGVWGGREVLAVEIKSLQHQVAANAEIVNKLATDQYKLTQAVADLAAVTSGIKATQMERGSRIQRLEEHEGVKPRGRTNN